MKLKSIPRSLGYVLGAQWTRDVAWTIFTILLARRSPEIMGEIVLALTFGYLVKTVADFGLNDYLISGFARREGHPRAIIGEVTWLKLFVLALALIVLQVLTGWQKYDFELRVIIFCVAGGLGLDALCDSFFAYCQARGRQDVEMRVRAPAAVIGIGFGIAAVALNWSPILISLYKPIESVICASGCVVALKGNPLARVGLEHLKDLLLRLKNGIVFTGMAACAMFYNKINVIFLKKYGGDADVGGYGVAWETIEGLSVLISGALLGKVIFPVLARYWRENREAFRRLAGQTARSLWGAALPLIYLICVESDRYLPFIYGPDYDSAVTAQRLLTPCLATAFLHNLAAYAMIGMKRHKLLFAFYLSGLIVNLVCCFIIIPLSPLDGAALSLTITKVWVAVLTVSFFQWSARPMSLGQWALMGGACAASVGLWWGCGQFLSRLIAEVAGLLPLLALFWLWRPPSLFEKKTQDGKTLEKG